MSEPSSGAHFTALLKADDGISLIAKAFIEEGLALISEGFCFQLMGARWILRRA